MYDDDRKYKWYRWCYCHEHDHHDAVFLIENEVDQGGVVFVFVATANVTTIDGDN